MSASGQPVGRVAIFSRGIAALPGLPQLLGAPLAFKPSRPEGLLAVAGWGLKPTAARARAWAAAQGLPYWGLEDGFLRSVGLGSVEPPLSVVVDDLGIYYDAAAPSRLERLVLEGVDAVQAERALALVADWRAGRVSKYNHAREECDLVPSPACGGGLGKGGRAQRAFGSGSSTALASLANPLPNPPPQAGEGTQHVVEGAGDFILVADQTWGDAAITHGLASATSFAHMLEAALDEHPQARVLLKVHPEVFSGAKRGHFGALTPGQAARVQVLAADVHPPALLERAAAVYAVTSQLGFEGLLWGKAVRCFGMPFYAGWALTADALAPRARRAPASLAALVHAALIAYPRYRHPETQARCEVEDVLRHLALQRRMQGRFAPQVHAVGFSAWKKPIVRAYFGGSTVQFVRSSKTLPASATVAVWGRKNAEVTPERYARVLRLEDGFLRSVGLGADLTRPLSWVMDDEGIYYDATRPSALETLLQTRSFTPTELARAAALRARICAMGITKYNVGSGEWRRPGGLAEVILVPGQVEDDASIRFGSRALNSNLALLKTVRAAFPTAHVLYKPHPDVVARLRARGQGEAEALQHCNELIGDVPMHRLLDAVDAVHTLTSLTGFEALLRGKRVHCYGQPFYAGWGLTVDAASHPRRSRRLSLDELTTGVLLAYPTYVSRVTGRFTTPERVLDELAEWHGSGVVNPQPRLRQLRRALLGYGQRLRRWLQP